MREKLSSSRARNRRAIDAKAVACERAGTQWASGPVCACGRGSLQACNVSCESFRMCQQKMREQNRLRVLHMRHASHRCGDVFFGLFQQRRWQLRETHAADVFCRVHDEQAEIRGDEFVAAASSA